MRILVVKQFGKTKAGGMAKVSAAQAKALIKMGYATAAPAPEPAEAPRPKRTYQRRDMVAEPTRDASAQPAALPPVPERTMHDSESRHERDGQA